MPMRPEGMDADPMNPSPAPPPGTPPLTESAVLRLNPALRPEARYKALVEILPDVLIVLFDRELRILSMEGGALDRVPVPAGAAIGKRLDELASPDQVSQLEPHMEAALRGEAATFDFDMPNGRTWWVHVIPMVDETGAVCGGMAQWRDVTARKAVERELQAYARELERSNAELEQFAYVASHDLSEPLRMITGYLRLLERRYADALDEDGREFVAFALDGAIRMRTLIDDLLTYSRVGRDVEPAEPVDVQALVETAWRTLTAGREGPPATLLATGLPTVMGDPQQLHQLFQNLLANALKFVAAGRAPVVEVRADVLPEGGWRFTVEDEGIGFDAEQAERIFRVFQRLHTRDEYSGTGVGLAIARKVVEHHGGRIWAEPREGGGARFRFDLPAGPLAP
jgi:PAS domain S-box-containing protein